MIFGEILKTS